MRAGNGAGTAEKGKVSVATDLVIEIENEPGALARVAAAVSDAGVNLAAATCIGPGNRAELRSRAAGLSVSIRRFRIIASSALLGSATPVAAS